MLGERSYLRVAGRTDAGVHATAQVVSLDAAQGHPATDPRRLRQSLNGLLPHDVAVREVTLVPDGFDARTHALSRTYDQLPDEIQAKIPLKQVLVLVESED